MNHTKHSLKLFLLSLVAVTTAPKAMAETRTQKFVLIPKDGKLIDLEKALQKEGFKLPKDFHCPEETQKIVITAPQSTKTQGFAQLNCVSEENESSRPKAVPFNKKAQTEDFSKTLVTIKVPFDFAQVKGASSKHDTDPATEAEDAVGSSSDLDTNPVAEAEYEIGKSSDLDTNPAAEAEHEIGNSSDLDTNPVAEAEYEIGKSSDLDTNPAAEAEHEIGNSSAHDNDPATEAEDAIGQSAPKAAAAGKVGLFMGRIERVAKKTHSSVYHFFVN